MDLIIKPDFLSANEAEEAYGLFRELNYSLLRNEEQGKEAVFHKPEDTDQWNTEDWQSALEATRAIKCTEGELSLYFEIYKIFPNEKNPTLARLYQYLSAQDQLDHIARLFDEGPLELPRINFCRYRPGFFLAPHCDNFDTYRSEVSRRRVSLLIHMTKNWQADWGGHLIFHHENRQKMVLPTFNTAYLFRSDLEHEVQAVNPSSEGTHRYSITAFYSAKA